MSTRPSMKLSPLFRASRQGVLPGLAMCAALMLAIVPEAGHAQSFRDFHNHNNEMKAFQPAWMTPLVGTSPLLGQFVREEYVRQKMPSGVPVWNIGNGKGPSIVLSRRVEVDFAIPNYVVHGASTGMDGMGDFCFTTRYRIISGNKQHGNYSLAAVTSQSWATGLAKNGAVSWTRGITLTGGKAFGKFAVLTSLGATIPASSGLSTIGRPIVWNSALELHATTRIWSQLESNSTFYKGGTHDGKKQNYLTPGIFFAPLKPWSEKSRSYLLLGVGMQIATTQYHASDHNLIVDTKLYF